MIRNLLGDVLAKRGWTGYRLAKESGLAEPTVYHLLNAREAMTRRSTLNTLCRVLECQPGDLMEYVPDRTPTSGARPRSGSDRAVSGIPRAMSRRA